MTLCPVAPAIGCKQCPAFSAYPLRGVSGDDKMPEGPQAPQIADQPKN